MIMLNYTSRHNQIKTPINTSPMEEPSSEAPKVERTAGVAKIRTDLRQLQGDMFFATGGRRLIGFDLHARVQDWGGFLGFG